MMRWIAGVAGLPQAVPKQHDRGSAEPIVFREEGPAGDRSRADDVEGIGRQVRALDPFGSATLVSHGDLRIDERRDPRKRLRRWSEVLQLRQRHATRPVLVVDRRDVEHAIRLVDRQSPDGMGVQDREQHVVDPDAEPEDEQRDERKAAILDQQPRRKPDVLRDVLQPGPHPDVTRLILAEVRRAKRSTSLRREHQPSPRPASGVPPASSARGPGAPRRAPPRTDANAGAPPADATTCPCRPLSVQDLLNREDELIEFATFGGQPFSTGGRQGVVARPPVVVGRAPFRLDPSVQQQSLKRRVERALADLEKLRTSVRICSAIP